MSNPETCRHNVLTPRFTSNFKFIVECVSCGSNRTDPEKRVGKNYEYDIDANVWVNVPKSSAGVNQFGIYFMEWQEYRDAEQEVGRRYIPFEDWRNEGPQGEIRV